MTVPRRERRRSRAPDPLCPACELPVHSWEDSVEVGGDTLHLKCAGVEELDLGEDHRPPNPTPSED